LRASLASSRLRSKASQARLEGRRSFPRLLPSSSSPKKLHLRLRPGLILHLKRRPCRNRHPSRNHRHQSPNAAGPAPRDRGPAARPHRGIPERLLRRSRSSGCRTAQRRQPATKRAARWAAPILSSAAQAGNYWVSPLTFSCVCSPFVPAS